MTTSALDIITGAAKLLGVVFKSEALSSDEANDGLIVLNDMLDSWSNDGLVTYAHTLDTLTLTGATSYTIGTGGTFNTSRPINIITAVVRNSSVDYPLKIITPEEYQTQIAAKSVTSQIPEYLTYDNGYPLGTIKMYTVPVTGSSLILLSNKPLSNLAALTTTVDLPPGWKRALKTNLAIELAAQYDQEPAASVVTNAAKSLGAIKRAVSINTAKPFISMTSRPYSILSDI